MRTFAIALFVVAALSANLHAGISAISGLYNTGVDNSGAVLPYGSVDPHYVIASSPDGGPLNELTMDSSNPGNFPIPPWLGDDTLSRWDSESTDHDGNEGVGTFNNVTTFVSSTAGTVTITGQWASDDGGTNILLNGVSTGITGGAFTAWSQFTITGPVTAGVNTLDFIQTNNGGPGGVRVEFTGGTVTPEPASLLVWGLAIAGGLVALRRRKA